ncbi:MAG: hypothetical protein AMXMBFR81_26860 [Chthonomonas sp.]
MEPLNRQGGRLQHGGGDGCGDQHGPVYKDDGEGLGATPSAEMVWSIVKSQGLVLLKAGLV